MSIFGKFTHQNDSLQSATCTKFNDLSFERTKDAMDIASERAYPTPYANMTILPMLLLSLSAQQNAPFTSQSFMREYDYIIVGAGSAGSTLASRLSELSCVNVLLLEAGKSPPILTDIPAIARFFINTDTDWKYFTEPQVYSGEALVDRKVTWPSGKALGGSSMHNAMFYVRGDRQNYDDWANQGAKGWSYEDVLPYFKKAENNHNPWALDPGYHGFEGPVDVEKPRYNTSLKFAVMDAAQKLLGIPLVDSNGRRQQGIYDLQATMRVGQRCSTAKAYLVPAEGRPNLDILINAHVTKILIKNRRAFGVQFDYGGRRYKVRARREVIMSAGTVNTAQLLMLSGIGPREHLERFGIPVVADLPVGLNFHDHQASFIPYVMEGERSSFLQKVSDQDNIMDYIHTRTGPLASSEGLQNIIYLPIDWTKERNSRINDFAVYFGETSPQGLVPTINLKPEIYNQYFRPYENKSMIICFSQILHPKSRGYVVLRSTDPYEPPIINPNYYKHPQDIKDVAEGLKLCNIITKTEPLQRLGVQALEGSMPGCEEFSSDEDEYLACIAKAIYTTTSHQVGTSKMGRYSDPSTVVDPTLRVKYVRSLRVVDASIMPLIPWANTNVPTIMVAEKAADVIKQTIECN